MIIIDVVVVVDVVVAFNLVVVGMLSSSVSVSDTVCIRCRHRRRC